VAISRRVASSWLNRRICPCRKVTPARPGHGSGPAPGWRAQSVAEHLDGGKTYVVTFAKGDEILSGLTEFCRGAIKSRRAISQRSVLCGPHCRLVRSGAQSLSRYPDHQQVELISLIGDVGLVNGAPQIHTHGAWASLTARCARASVASHRLADRGSVFHLLCRNAHQKTRRGNGPFPF